MLRLETETGWWLVTHPDHARLAGAFVEAWGNERFLPPEPRNNVLLGIRCHDDGWAARDSVPQVTREGKPSAFSTELVGKYSAFEEIDLKDYLAVRERAVRLMAQTDAYAGLLVSMHTCNLLTERADRTTIRPDQLPMLDNFLVAQADYQHVLLGRVRSGSGFSPAEISDLRIRDHFRLLQATNNLSLLSCVGYAQPATLLHPLPLRDGSYTQVCVEPLGGRQFRLDPYPFAETSRTFQFPARHVEGKTFAGSAELQERFAAAPETQLTATVCA
jgi:hypothetical protein